MTRLRVALFLVLFASYAYFYQAGGWNQNSRFNLVRAITNEHSLRVDPYHRSTGDQALFEGHYYSCLLYTSPSPRDRQKSRMPSSA